MQSWFVLKSGLVTGPFTSENVVSNFNNQNVMVWGLTCSEWLAFSDWENQLNQGSFKVEESIEKILLNPAPKLGSQTEAIKDAPKIFKIRPMSNSESVSQNESQIESPKEEITNLAPLPKIPSVDDIFASDVEKTQVESNSSYNNLDDQLKDLLTADDFDNDGKTLIQATMDSLSDDLSAESIDGSTQVQSFSFEDVTTEDENNNNNDGSTIVQELNLNLESSSGNSPDTSFESGDGSTQVQSFGFDDLSTSDGNSNDGSTTVQEFDLNLGNNIENNLDNNIENKLENNPDTNLEFGDGSTQVQDFSLENLSPPTDNLEGFSVESSDPIEKTNVAELKGLAQVIEQNKILEKPIWYLAYDGVSEGPINVETLLKKLDSYEDRDFIYLWKKGFPDWQNLFDTPQISSQLGIGFRRHDRHPFAGTVKIEFNGNIQIGQLENLSISGLGATGFGPLILGEKVKVTLDCPDLDQEVEFVAIIRFTSDLGVLGLSYIKAEYTENVNKVIELVKSLVSNQAA